MTSDTMALANSDQPLPGRQLQYFDLPPELRHQVLLFLQPNFQLQLGRCYEIINLAIKRADIPLEIKICKNLSALLRVSKDMSEDVFQVYASASARWVVYFNNQRILTCPLDGARIRSSPFSNRIQKLVVKRLPLFNHQELSNWLPNLRRIVIEEPLCGCDQLFEMGDLLRQHTFDGIVSQACNEAVTKIAAHVFKQNANHTAKEYNVGRFEFEFSVKFQLEELYFTQGEREGPVDESFKLHDKNFVYGACITSSGCKVMGDFWFVQMRSRELDEEIMPSVKASIETYEDILAASWW